MLSPPALVAPSGRRLTPYTLSAPIIAYCHDILVFTRRSSRFAYGLSSRAGLGLLRPARVWSLLAGRDYCLPEDV